MPNVVASLQDGPNVFHLLVFMASCSTFSHWTEVLCITNMKYSLWLLRILHKLHRGCIYLFITHSEKSRLLCCEDFKQHQKEVYVAMEWSALLTANRQLSEPSQKLSLQIMATEAKILTASSWEAPRQKQLSKLLLNSWTSETGENINVLSS